MLKYGYTSSGKQRWYCPRCKITSIKTRTDLSKDKWERLLTHWLLSNTSLTELSKTLKISKRSLGYKFNLVWQDLLKKEEFKTSHPETCVYDYPRIVILDATYIKREYVVLIARDLEYVLGFAFYQKENYFSWYDFLIKLFPNPRLYPQVIVTDGKGGLIQAINEIFGDKVKPQRCLFHIHLLSRVYLSLKPKTLAGKRLRSLIHQLSYVKTKRERYAWLLRFFLWFSYYQPLLEEKVLEPMRRTKRGKPVWSYKNKKLRAAFSLIKNSLPYLFTFLDYPNVPHTTNHLEGGINARLKELIHRHRGLSREKQKILITLFLKSKMRKPTTTTNKKINYLIKSLTKL